MNPRAAQAGERGARALVAAALDPFGGLDYHAAQALGEYGTSAYGSMRDTLRDKDVLAASRIWRLFRGTEKGKDLCLVFLCRAVAEEKDPAVRAACAASLPGPASENLDLRERAAAALEASSKEDPDEGVRKAAWEALGKIPGRR